MENKAKLSVALGNVRKSASETFKKMNENVGIGMYVNEKSK